MPAESNIGSSRSPLDVVGGYLARGWSPIPIPPRCKAPRANGWQKTRLAKADLPNHFTAHSNVGILLGEPSGWLVDIDLDHPLAIEWADQFLPMTGADFGRSSAPRSHRLYHVTASIDTHKRQLPDKTMVVELRSTGCQTVFPGSVHPSGETVEWFSDEEPAEIDPQVLVNAVNALADWVVTLVDVATAEPHEGDKQALALSALAGLSPARADSYHEWVTVGMALHSVGADDEMLAVWDEWSRKSAKYQEGKGECAAKWCGFGRKQGVTLGTLIHFARQDGWQVPHERNGKGKHPVTNPAGAAKPTRTKRRPPPVDPFKPFPIEILPDPVRSLVVAAAHAIGCDASYVALPLLAALAATIGNKRRIKLKPGRSGWCEPSVLWCAIVGESGTLKSPALDIALAPLRRRQTKALQEWREAMKQFERDALTYDADHMEWKKAGRKKGEPPPQPPEEPKPDRFLVSVITVEALVDRLNDNPNGLLMEQDELAGWIGSFNQYKGGKGGDVPQWLSMHRAGPVLSDRKTGRKILFAERGAVSVCGGIQPEILRQALAREHFEDGLGARLLLAMPPAKAKRWTDATVDDRSEEAVEMIFSRLLSLEPAADSDGNDIPFDLPLTAAAKTAWVAWYNSHAQEQSELAGDLAAAWSKLEGYAARLALVMHLVRVAADDPTIESSEKIDEASIRAGCILSDWFGQEARRVYGVLGESDEDREDRRFLELIQRKGGRITARELRRADRRFRDSTDAAEAALEALVKAEFGSWQMTTGDGQGGRPTRVFQLSPLSPIDETLAKPDEMQGFGDGDNGDASNSEECEWTG